MEYPRMNKNDYPPLPATIESEEDYNHVLEFQLKLAYDIERMQQFKPYPLADEAQKEEEIIKNNRMMKLTEQKRDELCNMIDEWRGKGG